MLKDTGNCRARANILLKEIQDSDIYSTYLNTIVEAKKYTPNSSNVIVLEDEDEYMLVEKKVRDIFTNSCLCLSHIDSGCYRAVFSKSDLVAKITYNEDGSNRRELHLIEHLKLNKLYNLLNYLCPVIASNDKILITPLCTPLFNYSTSDANSSIPINFCELAPVIMREFSEAGICFNDTEGVHQWGILDNNLVILDYADWRLASNKEVFFNANWG